MFKLGSKQKGLSLIEALLVLGLLATIITVITQNFQEASLKQKIQTVNQEVFQIYASMQENFSDEGTASFTGSQDVMNEMAYNLGVKPATTKGSNKVWRHGLEGVYNLSNSGSGNYGFSLAASKIPHGNACSELVRASKKTGWTHIAVGGAIATAKEVELYTPSVIAEDCKGTTNLEIIFAYQPDD